MDAIDDILNAVTEFADRAHGLQTRKYTPEKYIVHPISVMNLCRQHAQSLPLLTAALLHDVLEDTSVKQEQIAAFLSSIMDPGIVKKVLSLVLELTDVYTKQDFPHLNRDQRKKREIERLSKISVDAQTIKYADILDNSREILQHDRHFAPRFLKECKAILMATDQGLPALRTRALEIVDSGLAALSYGHPIKNDRDSYS